MLLVKTKIGPSKIHGIGLFADEFIPKGTIVWRFVPGKDEVRTKDEVEKLQEPKRSEILSLHHSYVSKQTGRYIYFGDHSGYFNHSNTPNVGTKYKKDVEEDINFSLCDITPDEEMTIDYRGFAAEGVDF
ncbi:hypothetical protein A2673_04010 [Candidatus Kaiserbacteria bacterium RIFCSPHIGHO2_01_FULL_50_13]|uniref:SET domain-containing protein n=1 Tax=Candidatus Kaiserbacteria bacterium RIFCSPLOWO2_01_FULL_50_24 TaxID=1798507 RepID=A0A1F6ENG1_9BACT|nr:MAG: hypothetical protein A2673_04010 [Candidatus Kaiserbacteria bacterium RIFCSPHIGHO2_01_FULL_50_13]OGG75161.1 MAG: hypothetical protein A3A34_02300 [Candidatus Kaiserbacteria bacterium RIFCSPLOWO2_01_FULL_50_24]OGG81049.1 MAG: hypothetical protein A3H74_00940 [Candidatus Kaiserbacteria bacterium RIFCSPLOWO2_02_FULL_51_13]